MSWSLVDMKYRRTNVLSSKPGSWMVWGVNERFKWLLDKLPFGVFIYVAASPGAGSGLALYGTALEPVELAEAYWPRGGGWRAFYLEVELAAPGVLDSPEDPARWRLVSRDALERLGVRVLPGPQRLGGEVVGALKGLLPVRVS
ncbi:MAG: hypothetical protein QXY55_05900, partial [Candidatus Korarchaeota archaeon]